MRNGKQTVISRLRAASQRCSAVLSACPRRWGGAAAAVVLIKALSLEIV